MQQRRCRIQWRVLPGRRQQRMRADIRAIQYTLPQLAELGPQLAGLGRHSVEQYLHNASRACRTCT